MKPMTDCEAGLWLTFRRREACDRLLAGYVTAANDIAGYDAALQALADRQALVRAVAHATLLDTTLAETFDAARRHMEGQ
jgi:hypothetical protein